MVQQERNPTLRAGAVVTWARFLSGGGFTKVLMMTLDIIPIPAFRDNYIWLLQRDRHAVVVDPGDAAPVLAALQERQLTLDAILITHHHDDHIGGVAELLAHTRASVYAPRRELYPFPHQPVSEGDWIDLTTLGIRLNVLETPGHTAGHVVYYGANSLFCGDTLFGCGCGRLFEGSCQQLYQSLQRIAALPADTHIYCAHEYTQHNIRFARLLDPDNPALIERAQSVDRLRARGLPSLPSTLGSELATNPFLRCDSAPIRAATMQCDDIDTSNAVSVFCAIRNMRNAF